MKRQIFPPARLARSLSAAACIAGAAGAAQAAVSISPMAPTSAIQCTAGICVPTAAQAVLNAGDLETMLMHGDVTVTTHGTGGVEATDIKLAAPVGWAKPTTLTLIAERAVTVTRRIGVHGAGGLSITFNDGAKTGSLWFNGAGQVVFDQPSGSLSINGQSYALVFSLPALIAAVTANPDGQYALAAPVDASANGVYTASPIATPLTGTLEGLGNAITKLTIEAKLGETSAPVIVAPIAEVGAAGVVRNLNITNVNLSVTGSGAFFGLAGGIVGEVDSGGVLSNVHESGTVKDGGGVAGGVAAENAGLIDRSGSIGTAIGQQAAGLVALTTGTITNSYSGGQVEARGANEMGGGLVAHNRGGSISTSYSASSVTGTEEIGGLVGDMEGGSIVNCYALGSLTLKAGGFLGGLVGGDTGSITSSYSSNKFTSGQTKTHVGGAVGGPAEAAGNDVYWNVTTSGTTTADASGSATGFTGLTTHGLQSGLPQGFNPMIWGEKGQVNGGLPYLISTQPISK